MNLIEQVVVALIVAVLAFMVLFAARDFLSALDPNGEGLHILFSPQSLPDIDL